MYLRTEPGNPLTRNRRRKKLFVGNKNLSPFPQHHTGTLHLIVCGLLQKKAVFYASADNNAYTNVEERRFSAA
jgi:hypothetical protein